MLLTGEIILVTGAAGRIGSETSLKLLENGATVVLSDISNEILDTVYKKLSHIDSSRIYRYPTDITDDKKIKNLIKTIVRDLGKIDSAIHCAYPTSKDWGTKFEALEKESLNLNLSMQLGSAILFSQSILNHFKEKQKGHLIHLSSIQGICAPKFDHYINTNMTSPIEYSAIKAGIISITKWLAKYYRNNGIRVNCISPGGILENQPESFIKNYRNSCTNIGMLNSTHIASAVLYLLSPASEAINGHNLVIDDGWSL